MHDRKPAQPGRSINNTGLGVLHVSKLRERLVDFSFFFHFFMLLTLDGEATLTN